MRTPIAFAVALSVLAMAARADTTCGPGVTPIPDGTNSASRALEVVGPATPSVIVSASVSVSVSHPWVGDLRLVLKHPSGVEVVLLDRPGLPSLGFPGPWGCGGADIAATFEDAAALEAELECSTSAVPVLAGTLKPLVALSAFNGLAPQGTWTLLASDLAPVDAGTLGLVCLTLTLAPGCDGDLDSSGAVDGADLAIVLGAWGACVDCGADINHDGAVNGADLAIVLGAWGTCH